MLCDPYQGITEQRGLAETVREGESISLQYTTPSVILHWR